jgi:hypothetical protein
VEVVRGFDVLHHHGATIGRISGGARRQNPALLWADLLRWARKQKGAAWAERAALALRLGARLRLFARRLLEPGLSADARREWRDESQSYRQALLAAKAPENRPSSRR